MITTIIAFIIIFGILVIVHEFGHFIVAKKLGVMVREFSIGMGPKIFEHFSHGTQYTLRLLPIGGYVRMAGDFDDVNQMRPGTSATLKYDKNHKITLINLSKKRGLFKGLPIEVTKSDLQKKLTITGYVNGNESKPVKTFHVNHDAKVIERNGRKVQIDPADVQYMNAPAHKKLLINFAGVFNNVLLAIIAFALVTVLQGGVMTNTNKITPLPTASVARNAGIRKDTAITAVNGHRTKDWNSLQDQITKHPDKRINLTVRHNNEIHHVSLKTKSHKISGKHYGVIGVEQVLNHNPLTEIESGFSRTWDLSTLLFGAIGHMIAGHFSLNDLSGPVGIFATTKQVKSDGIIAIINFLGFLSINLAIMNCLPFPALDGGKIIANFIELIRRKPVSKKILMVINVVGLIALMLLMVLVTWNDIYQYFIK